MTRAISFTGFSRAVLPSFTEFYRVSFCDTGPIKQSIHSHSLDRLSSDVSTNVFWFTEFFFFLPSFISLTGATGCKGVAWLAAMVSLTTVSSWTGSSTSSTTCASSMSSSTWGDSRRCVKFAFGPTSTTGDTRVATRESPVLLVSPSELPLERPSGKALEVAAGDRGAHLDVAWNGERGTGPATIAAGKKKNGALFFCFSVRVRPSSSPSTDSQRPARSKPTAPLSQTDPASL